MTKPTRRGARYGRKSRLAASRRNRFARSAVDNDPGADRAVGERPNPKQRFTRAEILTIVATLATACAAIGSVWVARETLIFAQNSADDTAKDTRTALGLSQRAAEAAEKQSVALNQALSISDRVAEASEIQAETSKNAVAASRDLVEANRETLQEQRQGHIKITATVGDNYTVENERPFFVNFHFVNVGTTTIHDAEIAANIELRLVHEIDKVWNVFPDIAIETLPPGGEELVAVMLPHPITPEVMAALGLGEARIVAAAKARFVNKGERKPVVRYACYQYFGLGPNPVALACPTPSQRPR